MLKVWKKSWDVKDNVAYVLQFFSLISDDLGGVNNTIYFYPDCRHFLGQKGYQKLRPPYPPEIEHHLCTFPKYNPGRLEK